MTKLVSVYFAPNAARYLFDLLREREPHQNISHETMPNFEDHCVFIRSRPYQAWYLLLQGEEVIGSIYLTRQREVGLFIFKRHHGNGYGREALALLREKHPGRLLANVSIRNAASIAFFTGQGFALKQITLEHSDA